MMSLYLGACVGIEQEAGENLDWSFGYLAKQKRQEQLAGELPSLVLCWNLLILKVTGFQNASVIKTG